ncbi:MFS transporter [Planctobacterium marinum]|uniref:MFS transporter n=1 Tax=Planctobacterium marinum TaxID=1631968 RepID=UPI001E29C005|nr:MFS transporter [Planctobacterium marinum]MCC2607711.1 MFS transporter [Planctobacterium marinum]
MNQTEIRGALSLAFVYLMRMLGLFMVMPVLVVLAQDYPDYTPVWVGAAIGAYGLSQALLQIPMGMLSDKLGRKPVIIGGLVLFAFGSLIAAMADSMWLLTLGRFLQGTGAIAGAIMALAADISRENQRSKVMATIGIAIGFSFYLSLIIGPLLAASAGLQGIFLITAVLALICIPLVLFGVPNVLVNAPSGDTLPGKSQIKHILQSKSLLRLNVSVLLLHMMITLVFVQFPVNLQNLGWELGQHWMLYLPILLLAIVGMALLMGAGRKLPGHVVIIVALWLMAIAFVGLANLADSFYGLMAFIILFFTGFNYLEANLPAMVANIAPPGKKGSAMGVYASFQFFGAFLGGLVSGLILANFGSQLVWYLAAGICILWTGLFVGFHASERLSRYTLTLNLAGRDLATLQTEFNALPGISEYTIVPDESAVYLKVQGKHFDILQARKLADPEEN